MSFDPSIYYQHGNITGSDQSTDTGGGDTTAADTTATTPSKPSVQDLGNGYSLVSWLDEFGNSKSQIVPNKDAASVAAVEAAKIGAGAAGVSASITAGAANQRAAVQAEIDRARNAADAAHQAAMDALAQGNAAEARRQFDISSKELERYHTLDVGIRQQEANTAAKTAGYNIYKDLTDKASNPRNFMQQFFTNRGQAAPPGSAAYGNTAGGPGSIMPFESWLPNFMQQTLGSYGAPSGAGVASPAASASPSPAAPNMGIPVGAGGAISDWARTHGYSAAGAAPAAPAASSPSQAGQSMQGGNAIWTGGPYSGMRVDQTPANAGDLTPYQKNPNLPDPTGRVPQQFAGGGTLHMTAPHAIVNMLSGKVAAVAGEQRGKGPQGFVPEQAKFSGKAIIDPLKGLSATDATPPDGTLLPDTSTDPGVYAPTYNPDTGWAPIPEMTGAPVTSSTPTPTPTPVIPGLGTQPAPPGFHWVDTQLIPNAVSPMSTVGDPGMVAPPPPPQTIFGPPINPSGANPWGGPVTTPSNPANPPPATTQPPATTPNFDFTQTPSGLRQNPQFLPEDAAAKDPILAQMLAAGSFPPFLQRLYAQAKGLPGLGTNVPQTTNLPNDVPLISQIALNQMSPSEFQAFQSFLSAHGIDWNDYVAMVQAASPQGGTSRSNAVPRFLSQ